jgi:hypothetical protein
MGSVVLSQDAVVLVASSGALGPGVMVATVLSVSTSSLGLLHLFCFFLFDAPEIEVSLSVGSNRNFGLRALLLLDTSNLLDVSASHQLALDS